MGKERADKWRGEGRRIEEERRGVSVKRGEERSEWKERGVAE